MSVYKVKDKPHLVRDSYSKAVIVTDSTLLEEHRRKKQVASNIQQLNNEINGIKNEMNDIKHLLSELLKTRR